MHGLAVWQEDNTKIPAVHLSDSSPAPHAPISLDVLSLGGSDHTQNPFVLDQSTVGTGANRLKVLRHLHGSKLPLALIERKLNIMVSGREAAIPKRIWFDAAHAEKSFVAWRRESATSKFRYGSASKADAEAAWIDSTLKASRNIRNSLNRYFDGGGSLPRKTLILYEDNLCWPGTTIRRTSTS